MATLEIIRERGIDIFHIHGDIDDSTVEQLRQTISKLRQQKSTKLLLLGDPECTVRSRQLGWLENAIRNYRMVGGVIALAQFGKSQLRMFQNTIWYRHINCFQTAEEAKTFLLRDKPSNPNRKQMTPIIHDLEQMPEEKINDAGDSFGDLEQENPIDQQNHSKSKQESLNDHDHQ